MKYLNYIMGVLLQLQSFGCKKDFLDSVTDKSVVVRQDYVTDLKTTEEYLSGIYVTIGGQLFSDGLYPVYPDLIADDVKPAGGSLHYSWNQPVNNQVSSQNANAFSVRLYRIISDCSFVIEKAAQFQAENQSKANDLQGQGYALRAYAHFMLANIFAQQYNFTADGSHPGIAYVKTYDFRKVPTKRSSVAETYQFLIEDLNRAVKLLPAASTNKFVVGSEAAKALLARIYLAKGDFAAAKSYASGLATTMPIMKNDYPGKLFTTGETEAIWQLPPADQSQSNYTTYFPSFFFKTATMYFATNDIATLLNEDSNDKRKIWVSKAGTNWMINKYPEGVAPGMSMPTLAYYLTMIRSSEMYLIAAESYAQLGRTDSAVYYLDEIRKRANPSIQSTTATGTDLLKAIYKERRKELSFEGFRMFDLLRWKQPVLRQDAVNGAPTQLPYPSDKAIAPIPGFDALNGITQNSGY